MRWTTLLSVFVLVATACTGDESQEGEQGAGKVVFVSAGGSFGAAFLAAFLAPFETETGIDVQQVSGGDDPIAAVATQVESGNVQWDVVNCLPSFVATNPDIWEPIDMDVVTSVDDLVPNLVITDQLVPTNIEAFPLLAYRTDVYEGAQPSSWADFFDVENFPGPRAVPNIGLESATGMPAVALLADGVPPDQLIPYDLDRAYAKLDELKPDIRVFWTSFVQSTDVLRLGEVNMTITTDGRGGQLVAAGEPAANVFNEALRTTGGLCVPLGAPNSENAFKLLDYILARPEQQAIFTSLTYYGPPTNAGVVAAEELGVADFSSLHMDELIPYDSPEYLDYFAANSDELLNRWNEWVGA